jgi:beta-galactosidase
VVRQPNSFIRKMTKHSPINPNFPFLWHGGDYNPEQWPREVWDEDMEYMRQAGINTATIGVFSWVSLEPEEGVFTFEWLDDIMDLLQANDIHAVLATPSAAPPAWMAQKYPEILRVGPDRVRRLHGNRVNYNWASGLYREKTAEMAERLANRYGKHPALSLWHVSNEYGGEDYSALSHFAFIEWLQVRYENNLNRLNAAYWSNFWGHTYTAWDQIEIPGEPYSESAIHGLTLDWKRFVSDQMLDFYMNESAPLRRITPNIPITTNMMGFYEALDPWKWKDHVDVYSWDCYPGFTGRAINTSDFVRTAFTHDMYRSMLNKPFLMIESTPSSSNWYSAMRLKRPGMHRLEAMQAVAHGSEGVMYFQWRQSRGSQEKFHGAVVSHAGGPGTRIFEEVAEVGRDLRQLSEVVGTTSAQEVAVVYDWENAWALQGSCGPVIGDKNYLGTCLSHYRGFWEQSIPCAVIDSEQSFEGYRVIVAPMLYMLKPRVAERLTDFVKNGGTLITTYLTGIVDESDLDFQRDRHCPLAEVLGIETEEIDALFPGETVGLMADIGLEQTEYQAQGFCDLIAIDTATVRGDYKSEFYAGRPFLTQNLCGKGEAWYIAARTNDNFLTNFYGQLAGRFGLARDTEAKTPQGIMAVRRGDRLFFMNFTEVEQTFLVDGEELTLGPYDCRVKEAEVLALL